MQCLYTIWGACEPAPVSAIAPALMNIDVLALGGRLTFLAPFSGPGGLVTLLSAIMGVYEAVQQPLGPVTLLSAIMSVYGAVRLPWGGGDVAIYHCGCIRRRHLPLRASDVAIRHFYTYTTFCMSVSCLASLFEFEVNYSKVSCVRKFRNFTVHSILQ